MTEEVDWEAAWSNMVENGVVEDRFSNTVAEATIDEAPSVEMSTIVLENIDQSVAQLATQISEGWQQLTDEVQRNFTDDWVKIVCDDMQESLLKEEKEEAKENIELGWTEMLLPSQQRLPFKDIRKYFGITIHEMVESVQVDNVVGTYSEGKSGEVLVISKDLKFVLKTLSYTEYLLLFTFLPAYLQHVKENPMTLLVRFYATFMSRGQYFIVMNNIFATGGGVPKEKYDLKGATSQRYTPTEFRTKGRTLKDGDFIDSNRKIYVPRDTYQVLNEQIRKDCAFLASQHVMDYSLLVGVIYESENEVIDDEKDFIDRIAAQPLASNHGITKTIGDIAAWLTPSSVPRDPSHFPPTQEKPPSDTEAITTESRSVSPPRSNPIPRKFVPPTGSTGNNYPNSFSAYNADTKQVEHVCLGIIDMFMYYHEGRALFSMWRTITGEVAEEISTVDPVAYADRFSRWMGQNVFKEGEQNVSVEVKK